MSDITPFTDIDDASGAGSDEPPHAVRENAVMRRNNHKSLRAKAAFIIPPLRVIDADNHGSYPGLPEKTGL